MRAFWGLMAIAGLAACQPTVPDSGKGVGFDDYDSYIAERRARDAALQGTETVQPPARDGDEIARDTMAALGSGDTQDDAAAAAARAANSGEDPVQADPSNPAPVLNSAGISRENDFSAVSDQRTIESDAERIARNRAAYEVIQPTALPSRSGNAGPNLVEYALQTSNPIGQSIYKRSSFNAESRYQRNCAKYLTSDQAQSAFLANGGPQKDRLGLDPDGDGYACRWDPSPFRTVRQATNDGN